MADATDERHRYGQHYTPPEVARLLAAFAVRSGDDLVFDPSCGDGRLLIEALALKRELSSGRARSRINAEIYGADRSRKAVRLAIQTGAQVAVADFLISRRPGRSPEHLSFPLSSTQSSAIRHT